MAGSNKRRRPDGGTNEAAVRVTRNEVADALRQRVVSGHYTPGARLPTCEALANELGASHVTVLRGIDQLRREGFLRTKRCSGVYVASHPPHLFECAMLFGTPQDRRQADDRYMRVMSAEIQRAGALPGPWRVRVWHGADPDESNPVYRNLVRQVQNGVFAGLIFPHSAEVWKGTPLVDHPDVARVATKEYLKGSLSGISMVRIDTAAYLERALDRVAECNRKRVAVIMPGCVLPFESYDKEYDFIMNRILERGFRTEPYWVVQISRYENTALRRLAHLLLARPSGQRPDALIVMDDHMTHSVTQGVKDAGVTPPEDLTLISYCNFPDKPEAVVPVTRLGFDCHVLFRMMIDAIEAQRRTKKTTNTFLKPVFEEELFVSRERNQRVTS